MVKGKQHEIGFSSSKLVIVLLYIAMIVWLVYGSGIVSDDFAFIHDEKGRTSIYDSLIGSPHYLARPVFKVVYAIFYYFVDLSEFRLIDILKIVQLSAIFLMVFGFFRTFLNDKASMVAAFLFIFFPSHDSTAYWYLEISLTLSIGLYLYAYCLVWRDRLITTGLFATVASFVSYGSPPIAFSLFVLCVLKKSVKRGMVLLIPNIIYSVYFVIISRIIGEDVKRLPADFSLTAVFKQFLLQMGTFIDAVVGPSFLLKCWYAMLDNTWKSLLPGVLFIVGYVLISRSGEPGVIEGRIDKKLLAALIVLTLSSMGMFALTGYYPQLAFNLGNRTTIYGSLLFAYLIVTIPIAPKVRHAVIVALLIVITGVSAHWKEWSQHQTKVIDRISNNKDLESYGGADAVYVSGNQYSQLGPFSHIEFFSEAWVANSILKLSVNERLTARTLNKRHIWQNGTIIDKKYNAKAMVGDAVMVYDSENDRLLKLKGQDLNGYIKNLPDDKRHWIQFIENKYVSSLILKLMPRLKYAF